MSESTEVTATDNKFKLAEYPKMSKWRCYLFGSSIDSGFVWQPSENGVPNWFWRQMQFLVFGNRWVKNKD